MSEWYDARKPPGTVTAAIASTSTIGQPREYVPRTPVVNPALPGWRPDRQKAALPVNRGAAYFRSNALAHRTGRRGPTLAVYYRIHRGSSAPMRVYCPPRSIWLTRRRALERPIRNVRPLPRAALRSSVRTARTAPSGP